jgi:hypothetical protein
MTNCGAVIHGCTVTAQNFLAHACVLGESFLRHNPGAAFSALVVDDPPGAPSHPQASFELLAPADIGIDREELHARGAMYSTQGLAGSMKPDLLLSLLERGADAVLMLDADGRVYSELADLGELAKTHSVVLSPHILDPHPLWVDDSPEQIIMRAGVMNAGLVAVGAGAEPFLGWWSQRTRRRCVFDERSALALGQTWLTMAVSLFEHHVLRDRGCNVAGWNLHGRDVEWVQEEPMIDGGPLRHFHFAGGFDPECPSELTPMAGNRMWWASLRERPGAQRLARDYAQSLIANGYRELRGKRSYYEVAPDGARLEPWMRSAYRGELMRSELGECAQPPNPFTDGAEPFFGWLRQTAAERAGLLESQDGPRLTVKRPGNFDERELADALFDRSELLGRIGELELIRDESVAWAQRVSAELEQARARLTSADAREEELSRLRATMQSVWESPSWRLTRPLRAIKGLVGRAGNQVNG